MKRKDFAIFTYICGREFANVTIDSIFFSACFRIFIAFGSHWKEIGKSSSV